MKSNKKKILIIGSSRATFGYKKNLIKILNLSNKFLTRFVVTGMHLSKKHGYSINEIIKNKINIDRKIKIPIKNNNPVDWIDSLSILMKKISKEYNKFNPDIVLVTGDRAEMFISALTATYMNIPVAHIQAGDLSGHVDGTIRHAITKVSHLHFASCKDSYNRVINLGEQKFRVFNTGAPQLDDLVSKQNISKKKLLENLKFDIFKENYFLIINHPTLINYKDAQKQTKILMNSIKKRKEKKVIIYPNSDTGFEKIINEIIKSSKREDFLVLKNLERKYFIHLLSKAKALVGNSSCGILEASTFKIPVVNIGDRQDGRMQSKNIVNCKYKEKEILKKINYVLNNKEFRNKLANVKNPYGDGKSSYRIYKILKKLNFSKLINKKMTY